MQLAAAGHDVTAVDASAGRLARLRENLDRTHLTAELVAADALTWEPGPPVRRDPARRALLGDRHLPPPSRSALPRAARDHRRQRRAPGAAARPRGAMAEARRSAGLFGLLARTGGRRAGRRRVPRGNPDFAIDPPKPGELPDFVTPSPEGWVRILPGLLEDEGGLDGFFIARLVRARLIPSNRRHGRRSSPPRSCPPTSPSSARRCARSTRPAPTGSTST